MTLINTALDNLDHLGRSAGSLLFGQTPKSMIDLDSAVSESALSCRGQSFVSVIEINGNNTLVGWKPYRTPSGSSNFCATCVWPAVWVCWPIAGVTSKCCTTSLVTTCPQAVLGKQSL